MRSFLIVSLFAVALVARPAAAQVGLGIHLRADQFMTDSAEYDWGNNYGGGFRFFWGEKKLRAYGSMDVMLVHATSAPFYFGITGGIQWGPRGEAEGFWPYVGFGGGCVLDYGVTQTGHGNCSYAPTLGFFLPEIKRITPYVEAQYYMKAMMRHVSVLVGVTAR